MGNGKVELHAFDLLEIKVTDDAAVIEAATKKLRPKWLHLRNYGTADERRTADQFFEAVTLLANADKRAELIDQIFAQAERLLNAILSQRLGGILAHDTCEYMLQVLTNEYNFEAGLAARRLRDYFHAKGIEAPAVSGPGVEVPADVFDQAQPVEDLRAEPQADGVRLTWTLPDSHCDGVRVVRTQKTVPKSSAEGREIASGKLRAWRDSTAEPGQKYIYAVFSVFAGKTSGRCVHCDAYCLPERVESLLPTFVPPNTVQIVCPAPAGSRRVLVFRSADASPSIERRGEKLRPPPNCIPLGSPSKQPLLDNPVELGQTYYYHAVADFGGGVFSERVTASITIPARPASPRPKDVAVKPDHVSVAWEAAKSGDITFRLYRLSAKGTGSLARETPIYEGPNTLYDDKDLNPGRSCWYYVIARCKGLDSIPTCVGEAFIVDEVRGLQAVGGEGQVRLKWFSPPNVVRYVVRRRKANPPASATDGDPVPAATPAGVVDRAVEAGPWYVYRVACVFHDTNGREITTAGVVSEPCRCFRMPSPPCNLQASREDHFVQVGWDPAADGSHILICRSTLNPEWLGQPVPLADLEAGGRRVPLEAGHKARDRVEKSTPWYILATTIDPGRVVVNRVICAATIAAKGAQHGDEVVISWPWPEGVRRVRITRHIPSALPGTHLAEPLATDVERGVGDASEGVFTEVVDSAQGSHQRQYTLVPVSAGENGSLLLLTAPCRLAVNVGSIVPLQYRIVRKKRLLQRERLYLHLSLKKPVDRLPALRLAGQSRYEDGEEGDVLLRLPEQEQRLGPWEHEVEIPTPVGSLSRYGRLYVEDAEYAGEVRIAHPTSDKTRLE